MTEGTIARSPPGEIPQEAGVRYDRAIAAAVHGHYWVRPAAGGAPAPWLVGFHGYGENAESLLAAADQIPGAASWHLASVQALHPFYTRRGDVVAGWMTRFDRELAIADNTAYAAKAVEALRGELATSGAPVFAGFSQGVAMAYRAAAAVPCRGLVALAGDVPPEVDVRRLPPVLIGRGLGDTWYDEAKMSADLERLEAAGVSVETCVFEGGHEWTADFRRAVARFLARTAASSC
jgi:predicted esterase